MLLPCFITAAALLVCAVVIDAARLSATDDAVAQLNPANHMDGSWRALETVNPHACMWLEVEGTSISQPVAQADMNDRDFYLTHDLYGRKSAAGCIYLDARCNPSSSFLIVYGHRMGTSHRMFSDLGECYEQASFDQLGAALWSEKGMGTVAFQPFCALKVNQSGNSFPAGAASAEELSTWLSHTGDTASALNPVWKTLRDQARRVLVLVTCSSPVAGGSERTLVVFVANDYAAESAEASES